jgi:uncharacterized membrane protein YedE/YeeE
MFRSASAAFRLTALQGCAVMLAMMAAPASAAPFGTGENPAIVNVCAAQRAPLVELQKQYQDAEHARIGAAVGSGVLAGGAAILGMAAGDGLFFGHGLNHGPHGPHGVRPGGDKGAIAAVALIAAVQSSVTTYLTLKQQAVNADRRALAMSIDEDAAGQLTVGRTTAAQARALAACRTQQVTDYRARLAAASDADKRKLKHEGEQIAEAIRRDIALADAVVGHQADVAKVFTQARAMAEGRSEADVLVNQKPAYEAAASSTPLQMPAPSKTSGAATPAAPAPPPPPPPPPQLVLTTLRSATVRDSASASGKAIMTLPAHREVRPKQAATNGWYEIDVAGAPGFIRASSLSAPATHTASETAAAQPPALEPARNIQAYNAVVLEARDEGPDRMKTLLTGFS